MSRIGKKPIFIPQGVKVILKPNHQVHIQGPKGSLQQTMNPEITVTVEQDQLCINRPTDQKRHKVLHGLYRALVQNMVIGVSQGYKKELELVGVGYKANLQGKVLELDLGYAHKIYFAMPNEVVAQAETAKGKNPIISLESIDKQLLGQVAAKIRSLRKPEPYKGKGIRFVGEQIRRKATKTATK